MKVVAAIDCDLEVTPLATVSRLADELCGVPVLRRTVERVRQSRELAAIYIVSPPDQVERCRAIVGEMTAASGPSVVFTANGAGDPPYRKLMRTARKWSLDGWRGGLGGASALDEYVHCGVLAALAEQAGAPAIMSIPGSAAIIDPALIDQMIEHYRTIAHPMGLTFAPVPPGLTGVIFDRQVLSELARNHLPPGWPLAYKPQAPQADFAFKECCFPSPQTMRHACGRVCCDTRRGFETVQAILGEGVPLDGESLGRWLLERSRTHVPELPREVEIELATATQDVYVLRSDEATKGRNTTQPAMSLRPRGAVVPTRGPIDVDLVRRIAGELAAFDDALVVLGGFGDPLLHPAFDEVCAALADAGLYGVALRTSGQVLGDEAVATIVRHRVDIVNVLIDAWTEDLYQRLYPGSTLQTVLDGIERLSQTRQAARQVEPLIVPEMVKVTATLPEMDAFFDGWIQRSGWANIAGFSHHAGQLEDLSVMDMSPPTRSPCRRLRTRCLILADGSMPMCDQDFKGITSVGSVHEQSLAELWNGASMQQARRLHAEAAYGTLPLCGQCCEWHRP